MPMMEMLYLVPSTVLIFKFLYIFAVPIECFLLPCLPTYWFSVSSNFPLILSNVAFISVIIVFMVSISLCKFSLSSPILFPSSLNILIISVLNFATGGLLVSSSFRFFFFPMECVLFFHRHVSLFWLSLCVCFYILDRYATFPCLSILALCCRCPVRPSGAAFPVTWAGHSRGSHCVHWIFPPVLAELWLLAP